MVFSYAKVLIHPLPDEYLDPDKWTAMYVGITGPPDGSFKLPLFGMVCADIAYARMLDDLILRWAYGDRNDVDHNLCVSVTLTGNSGYVLCCYPNFHGPAAQGLLAGERESLQESSTDTVIIPVHGTFTLAKRCRLTPQSILPQIVRTYKLGDRFLFRVLVEHEQAQATGIEECPQFELTQLKIKKADELDRSDLEYEIINYWPGP